MLVWLAEYLTPYISLFHVVSYLTFRAIMAILTALGVALWMGPHLIRRLQLLQIGQVVRNDGPESHFSKRGTPTMGGLMILASILISVLLWAKLSNPYVWVVLFVLVGYGAIGFVDDYRKVVRKDTKGLIARWKYFWQSLAALRWASICTPRPAVRRRPCWCCPSSRTSCRSWDCYLFRCAIW